jgi:hypothetical protein
VRSCTQQDTQFFEALYETSTDILLQAFPGGKRRALLVEELGRVLRTNQFNTAFNSRRNAQHISQSALTIRELYALKFEGDPALNSRKVRLLGDAKSSLGDAKRSLGDAKSSLGDTLRARWVTLRARWVTRRARWVTLRARGVTR